MVRFTEHSVSSETDHSEIRSLDDLFPVAAAPDSDDTLSERSAVLDGKTPVDSTSSNLLKPFLTIVNLIVHCVLNMFSLDDLPTDFKLNVMTLDDLAPIPFEAAEISQEKVC